jgi:ABC-2 type transport system permease protein
MIDRTSVLVFRIIRDQRKSLLVYLAIAIIFVWMYVALFPSIAKQQADFSQMLANYPEGLLKAFGIDPSTLGLADLEGFLSLEHYSILWPLLLIILLVSYASAAIAGEIEKGTIEVLLAQPLSRSKFFAGKYAAGLLLLFTFTFFSVLAVFPLAKIYHFDLRAANHLTMAALGFLFGLTIFCLTLMFSCIFSERGKAASLTGGILILMYALNIVASLKENVSFLKYFSFFYYYDYHAALVENHLEPVTIVVFLAVGLLTTFLGAFWFNRRDIAV